MITNVGIEALATTCSQLYRLTLWGCEAITDTGIASLVPLLAKATTAVSLDLDGTGITVASVLALARVPNLESLDVEGTNCILTDEALYALGRGCKKLKRLTFNDDESQAYITRAAVDALIATNPKLKNAFRGVVTRT
mmetsp:Transcript_12732/g.41756  ORF Transcript_12732/g.41756 Transcript_12732/m.41756 type:complete len:138 (+) Transcript_12732:966-1379(+)